MFHSSLIRLPSPPTLLSVYSEITKRIHRAERIRTFSLTDNLITGRRDEEVNLQLLTFQSSQTKWDSPGFQGCPGGSATWYRYAGHIFWNLRRVVLFGIQLENKSHWLLAAYKRLGAVENVIITVQMAHWCNCIALPALDNSKRTQLLSVGTGWEE